MVSYQSTNLRVMGYLGIPHRLNPSQVLQHLVAADSHVLVEEEIAVSLLRNHQSVSDANTDTSEKFGLFVYCRGGINRVGKVRTWWIEQFLRHDTVVFAPCYRGSEGGEGRDEFGGSDVADVVNGIAMLQRLPFINAHDISLMGFSRGSINAAAASLQLPDVRCLILWGGVADLAKTYEERVDLRRMLRRVVGGTPRRVESAYRSRSPASMASKLTCPVLLMHGTNDVQVDYSHALLMAESLHTVHRPFTVHAYAGQGHHMDPLVFEAVVDRMFDWIQTTPLDNSNSS